MSEIPTTPLPVKSGDVIAFTPPSAVKAGRDPLPVYHLRVPSLSDRADYERECVRRGAFYPPFAVAMAAARAEIPKVIPQDRADACLALVDDYIAMVESGGEDASAGGTLIAWTMLEGELVRQSPVYAAIAGDQSHWNLMSPLVALQMFWVKEENAVAPGAFQRVGKLTTEHAVEAIPRDEFLEVRNKAASLIRLQQAAAKNSKPRS